MEDSSDDESEQMSLGDSIKNKTVCNIIILHSTFCVTSLLIHLHIVNLCQVNTVYITN